MAHFTAAQRAFIRRTAARAGSATAAADEGGELNVVPFLDIVTNVLMFLLATIATTFVARLPLPTPAATDRLPSPAFELTVQVAPEGYLVAAPGGFLQPGCTTLGAAAVAVPLRLGQHDAQGLTACLVAARAQPAWHDALAAQRRLQVSAQGAVPYGVLVLTLDATRETRPGAQDLFPEPQLGILQ